MSENLPGAGHVNSDTFDRLGYGMRQQAWDVAQVLDGIGAYHGGRADALTDATAIVLAMAFAPSGDNHHNAKACPYCNPSATDEKGAPNAHD